MIDSVSWESTSGEYPVSFQISQSHLSLLETCPRKFQYIYLDQLTVLPSKEQQERLIQGSQFHLLMQQRELGLPIAPLAAEDPQLQQWLSAFEQAEPEILGLSNALTHPLDSERGFWRQSEHVRTLFFQGFLLIMIADLVIATPESARILDWKTYPRPQHARRLTQSWQTRLYPFILTETTAYQPEHVSMSYWFFQGADQSQAPSTPQSLTFTYSSATHHQIDRDLRRLLTQLSTWLHAYAQTPQQSLPQVSESAGQCQTCQFAVYCQRHPSTSELEAVEDFCLDFTQIPELEI
jgi:PD-(D/E)XK nuclease superfamily